MDVSASLDVKFLKKIEIYRAIFSGESRKSVVRADHNKYSHPDNNFSKVGLSSFKAIVHFRNRKQIKVHRFTNNLQGLQKVIVKDFSWNIIPWNSSLFEKNIKTMINSQRVYFKRMVMTRQNVRKQGWVFPLFSPDSDDPDFHRFVLLYYISCDTRSVGLWTICLPKVSNGLKTK